MPFNPKAKIRSGYVIAFILMIVSYFLIFYTIDRLVKGTRAVTHTYSSINALETLKSEIVDAETGLRGYVLTKDDRFLDPYHSAARSVPASMKELRSLLSDSKDKDHHLELLEPLVYRKMAQLARGLSEFQAADLTITDSMKSRRELAKQTMDSIRLLITEMKTREEAVMKQRSSNLSGAFTSTDIIAITSLVVALLTIIFSLMTYNRENKAKEKADGETQRYREELERKLEELKKVNAELQELKQIEKFAATGRIARTIAHEVRNPLTNITLATEQLQETPAGQTGDAQLFLDMIRRNAGRINQLVSDLLQSTRFAQLEFAMVDINNLMDETLDMAKDRVELNHIRVEKDYGNDLDPVSVDAEKMKFAMLNIIVNALEAMETGKGVLSIHTRKAGDKILVEVTDNGSGMDEDAVQKIFEPYFTSKQKGAGLGLTNTQNIILNHKGNISVKSKPGTGSSFCIYLNFTQ
ncbi:MAG TPA: CHASE3 domain-containing protein [Chitinophagaceae bacterium]|jgi:signal transduction histidine kinase|nr:CHASE3 domain-containing protein [Chitinophagaceae bacterium]